MAESNASSKDILEKIEQIQTVGGPEELHKIVEDLENDRFFVALDIRDVDKQLKARKRIGELLEEQHVLEAEKNIYERLQRLHDILEAEDMTEEAVLIEEAPVAPVVTDETAGQPAEAEQEEPMLLTPKMRKKTPETENQQAPEEGGGGWDWEEKAPEEDVGAGEGATGGDWGWEERGAEGEPAADQESDEETEEEPDTGPQKPKQKKTAKEKVAEAETIPKDLILLLRGILKNPDDLKRKEGKEDEKRSDLDIRISELADPSLRAIAQLLKEEKLWPEGKGFKQERFEKLKAFLHPSEKIPKPSVRALLAKFKEQGIETEDQLDREIAKLTSEKRGLDGEASDLKQEVADLEQEINRFATLIASKAAAKAAAKSNEPSDTDNYYGTPPDQGSDEENALYEAKNGELSKKRGELKDKNKELRTTTNELEDIKGVQDYYAIKKMTAREVLLKAVQFVSDKDETMQSIGNIADKLTSDQEKKMAPQPKLAIITRLFHPTLAATLNELTKVDELKEVDKKDLEELVRLRGNPDGLLTWMEKLKEKAQTVVPAIMAYLQMAIVEGKLNRFSRSSAMELLKNLRLARSKLITKKINNNPEIPNNPQIKMSAYLKEMNLWDEKRVSINQDIINDLVKKTVLKRLAKTAALGVAGGYVAPYIGFSAIMSAVNFIGWGTLGKALTLPAYWGGKKLMKTFKPEWKEYYKYGGTALVGTLILGPIGLAAPAVLSGLKFAFGHKEDIKKGAKTGKAVAGTGWAITKGITKAIAWPFKKLLGKKAA